MTAKKLLREKIKLGERELSVETGRVAKQAHGSVIVRYGDTMVLVAAVGAEKPREGIDFFPLTVEYREHNYAAGRIPGNYFRREGRPGEKEILTARMIDRPCRPLFTEGYRNETQVIASVISADDENDPDVLAITGASLALYLSDIPFPNPIAGVRVGLVDGRYLINPTYDEVRESRLNLVVAGTEEAIVMVEAGARLGFAVSRVYEDESLFNIARRPVTSGRERPNVTAQAPARGREAAAFGGLAEGGTGFTVGAGAAFSFQEHGQRPRLT